MANYITQLKGITEEQKTRIGLAEKALVDFRCHLQSPKFKGVDLDGSRKDWIATNDVDSRICEILDILQGVLHPQTYEMTLLTWLPEHRIEELKPIIHRADGLTRSDNDGTLHVTIKALTEDQIRDHVDNWNKALDRDLNWIWS